MSRLIQTRRFSSYFILTKQKAQIVMLSIRRHATNMSVATAPSMDDFEPFSKPCEKCGKTIGYNGKEVCKVSNFNFRSISTSGQYDFCYSGITI